MRPLEPIARWLRPLLAANVAVAGAVFVTEAWFALSLRDIRAADASTLALLTDASAALGLTTLVLFVVTATVFVVWFHRAYTNEAAAGWHLPHSTKWAIWGWVVPFIGLVRPMRIMRFLLHDGAPGRRPGEVVHVASNGERLLRVWWATFLISGVLGRVLLNSYDSGTVSDLRSAAFLAAITAVVDAILGCTALRLVANISSGQDSRFEGDLSPDALQPQPFPAPAT